MITGIRCYYKRELFLLETNQVEKHTSWGCQKPTEVYYWCGVRQPADVCQAVEPPRKSLNRLVPNDELWSAKQKTSNSGSELTWCLATKVFRQAVCVGFTWRRLGRSRQWHRSMDLCELRLSKDVVLGSGDVVPWAGRFMDGGEHVMIWVGRFISSYSRVGIRER